MSHCRAQVSPETRGNRTAREGAGVVTVSEPGEIAISPGSDAGVMIAPIRTLRAVRVHEAMGRGRSRPLIVEAEDGQRYVSKQNSSEKTARRLIVEVIAGHIARVLGLPQPEMVLLEIEPGIEAPEMTPEKRQELETSRGPAFGSRQLPDAVSLRRRRDFRVDPELAASIVWFDSLVLNHDRKDRNPNILIAGDEVWMIDNDSALAIHHRWVDIKRKGAYAICPDSGMDWWDPKDHVLLPLAGPVESAGDRLATRLSQDLIRAIVDQPPEIWIQDGFPKWSVIEPRQMYAELLTHRLTLRRDFEQHADYLRIHGTCKER
jgi:hypothetical protein